MRHAYLVTYDISDPKRLRAVYKLMLGWGEHVQLSVFHCELNARELVELKDQLSRVIEPAEDQVLFGLLGLAEGRARSALESLGRPYVDPERLALVV